MSNATDIFNSIINDDNIGLAEHIATALANRGVEKIELMREYVGKSLFRENVGIGTYYNADEYHPIHSDLKTNMSIAHRKEERKTKKFGGKSYQADVDEKNGENTEYEDNTRRKAPGTYLVNGKFTNIQPKPLSGTQLEYENEQKEIQKDLENEKQRNIKNAAEMKDRIDNNRGRK